MALAARGRGLATVAAAKPHGLRLSVPGFLKTSPAANGAELLTFEDGGVLAGPTTPVQLRSRYGLPGAKHELTNIQLPAVVADPRQGFPAVLQASTTALCDDPIAAARALKPRLDEVLPQHGAVMVHGLEHALRDAGRFSRFMETIKSEYDCRHFMEGRSMTSHEVSDLVRTGSDDHPAYTIEPHNEYNVAARHRPRKLLLTCSEEPTHGGEWIVTDATRVLDALPQELVAKFASLGVRYEVWYPSRERGAAYNNWEENIAPTRDAADAYLRGTGCEWEWDDTDGSLLIHRTHPALAPHPDEADSESAPMRWFNQIHAHHRTFYQDCHPDFEGLAPARWPCHTLYGDSTEIEDDVLAEIRRVMWESTVAVPMTLGSLLVVDNYRAMHGRMSFEPGTPRESLVSIIYA